MSPLSMTSFGRGEATADGRNWTVEVRSVNHRYCDISIKIHRKYAALEDRIKKDVSAFYSRGRVDVTVSYTGDPTGTALLEANIPLAREYYQCLEAIRTDLSLEDAPDLALLAGFREIIIQKDIKEDLDEVWNPISEGLSAALKDARGMREAEGQSLKNDLDATLREIALTVEKINTFIPEIIQKKQESLKERLDNLLKGVDIDPIRLAQETAIITDKMDVTEEIVRLRSHISQFTEFLDLAEPIGRRLDFLLQEFFREVNTIASKTADAPLAHLTVGLKNDIEKMREQVQNLE